jgi:diaminopimelate epimerase
LSCGTGSVASAIYSIINQEDGNYAVDVHTLGGTLTVELQKQDNVFANIWLCGKAIEVFEGNIIINL